MNQSLGLGLGLGLETLSLGLVLGFETQSLGLGLGLVDPSLDYITAGKTRNMSPPLYAARCSPAPAHTRLAP